MFNLKVMSNFSYWKIVSRKWDVVWKSLKTCRKASSGKSSKEPRRYKYGLKTLVEPNDAAVDIVFVHGLTGGRESTWTDKSTGVFWPRDLLGHDVPNARIMAYGYDADVVNFWSAASKNRLVDHARTLAGWVSAMRLQPETTDRPIIFVAHSLGGLLCEQMLVHSNNSAEEHIEEIVSCTKAIAFLGTPHCGSKMADWGKVVGNVINLIKKTNVDIIRVLKPDSEVLAMIRESFLTMLRKRLEQSGQVMKITCFWEELPVPHVGEIVPKDSAVLPGYECCGIPADHRGMARFKSNDDPGYLAVSKVLFGWINQIHKLSLTNPGTSDREAGIIVQTNSGDMQVTGEPEIIGEIRAIEQEEVSEEALMSGGL